jgi:hypothetical protein
MHLIRAAWTGSPVSAPPTHRAVGLMEASSFRSRRAVKGRSPPAAARETRALDSPSASEVLVSMRSTALSAEFTSRRWPGASARGRSAARSIVAGGTGRFAFGLRLAEPWQLGERESLRPHRGRRWREAPDEFSSASRTLMHEKAVVAPPDGLFSGEGFSSGGAATCPHPNPLPPCGRGGFRAPAPPAKPYLRSRDFPARRACLACGALAVELD